MEYAADCETVAALRVKLRKLWQAGANIGTLHQFIKRHSLYREGFCLENKELFKIFS